MTDGISAMWEEAEDYVRLCKKYREKPMSWTTPGRQQMPSGGCDHHRELVKREHSELDKKKRRCK